MHYVWSRYQNPTRNSCHIVPLGRPQDLLLHPQLLDDLYCSSLESTQSVANEALGQGRSSTKSHTRIMIPVPTVRRTSIDDSLVLYRTNLSNKAGRVEMRNSPNRSTSWRAHRSVDLDWLRRLARSPNAALTQPNAHYCSLDVARTWVYIKSPA